VPADTAHSLQRVPAQEQAVQRSEQLARTVDQRDFAVHGRFELAAKLSACSSALSTLSGALSAGRVTSRTPAEGTVPRRPVATVDHAGHEFGLERQVGTEEQKRLPRAGEERLRDRSWFSPGCSWARRGTSWSAPFDRKRLEPQHRSAVSGRDGWWRERGRQSRII
jgi:hypothetical protein